MKNVRIEYEDTNCFGRSFKAVSKPMPMERAERDLPIYRNGKIVEVEEE